MDRSSRVLVPNMKWYPCVQTADFCCKDQGLVTSIRQCHSKYIAEALSRIMPLSLLICNFLHFVGLDRGRHLGFLLGVAEVARTSTWTESLSHGAYTSENGKTVRLPTMCNNQ
jgi:hypothetical protein